MNTGLKIDRRLSNYLEPISGILSRKEQKEWLVTLADDAKKGWDFYLSLTEDKRRRIDDEFRDRIRTEEIKAWYSEPQGDELFQGTSVSSLTVPYKVKDPLKLESLYALEDEVADSYINLHDKYKEKVRGAILEDIDEWLSQGLYYGVVIGAKVISQALDLSIPSRDVVFEVNGHHVDPHEILSYPTDIRKEYFNLCREKINCFGDLDIEQREFESSLVLSDISKPKIAHYKEKILLAPIRCNEIAAMLSENIVKKIIEKSEGRIKPKGLSVVIYDTDTPYTYHKTMGYSSFSPVLPGLAVLGASGTINAFRWLYAYRLSLIAQKVQKSSLYSEVERCFIPFMFFGVLVWRDAEILLDLNNLSKLRYKGNISADLEFGHLLKSHINENKNDQPSFSIDKFKKDHLI